MFSADTIITAPKYVKNKTATTMRLFITKQPVYTIFNPTNVTHCLSTCGESIPLRWRHNDHAGVLNHQPHGCLLNRLFRRRSNKTSKLRVTGLRAGNSPGPVNSPHKGPVTRKMFPFDDVIMHGMKARLRHPRGTVYFLKQTWGHFLLVSTNLAISQELCWKSVWIYQSEYKSP